MQVWGHPHHSVQSLFPLGVGPRQPACALRLAAGSGFPWPRPDGHVRVSAALPGRPGKGQAVPLVFPVFSQKPPSAQSLAFYFSFFGCSPPPGTVQSIINTGGNSLRSPLTTHIHSSINGHVLQLPHACCLAVRCHFWWTAGNFIPPLMHGTLLMGELPMQLLTEYETSGGSFWGQVLCWHHTALSCHVLICRIADSLRKKPMD